MKRAGIYARVSTSDGRQTISAQTRVLDKFARERGIPVARKYIDQASGTNPVRPGLDSLLADARAGKIDGVLVFALDRITREGVLKAFETIHELARHGVEFVSVTEPHFTTSGPAGELFIAIAAWMAKQERELIRARVKAGLAEAVRRGATLGRPKVRVDRLRMQMLYVEGKSLREIAAAMGLKRSTVERASREWRQKQHGGTQKLHDSV